MIVGGCVLRTRKTDMHREETRMGEDAKKINTFND